MRKKHIYLGEVRKKDEMKIRLILDSILAEYKEVKAESIHKLQIQITIISLYITIFGVLLTLGFQQHILSSIIHSMYFYCLIFPVISISISVIWIDQVYRQIKLSSYILLIEKKVNELLGVNNNIDEAAMFWEQWLRNDREDKNFIHNYSFYCICLGIFLLFPLVSWFCGYFIIGGEYNSLLMSSILFFGSYLIFICFIIFYLLLIFKYHGNK
ncbi:hypothetical protein [Breznakia pachnodae]|uniref:Uncharacterized protein n=1 Tax=Breznakia pachnodae TaxID=265178 RepID=A0ABU0DXU4_9FIRM|nr:hypothetical protein [Breznakia pachnodae]MDQ0359455.1 hypothetical protein [Breznakia pachnodae]